MAEMTMDATRRAAYLRAMGITRWVLRRPPPAPLAAPAPVAANLPSPVLAAASVAEPVPTVQPVESVAIAPQMPRQPLGAVSESRRAVLVAPVVASESAPAPVAVFDQSEVVVTEKPMRDFDAVVAVPELAPEPVLVEPELADWEALRARVRECRACALCETRTQTVFGAGHLRPKLLLIGEAPGADEDQTGEPFVGRAGQLLTAMLVAMNLTRDQVFIANVVKCRPPENRNPNSDEVAACADFLTQQIALLQPLVILAVGAVAAQNLLHTTDPVGRLRGRWLALEPAGIPLRVTYHPAYLLRKPSEKARAWDDLLAVMERLAAGAPL